MNAEWPTARLQMEDQPRPPGYRSRYVTMNDVRLVKPIPKRRLRLISGNGNNIPVVGDLGESDHCYTGPWGQMVTVYFTKRDGSAQWEAEAYTSEIASVIASRVDVSKFYDADALCRSGELPWTIFGRFDLR